MVDLPDVSGNGASNGDRDEAASNENGALDGDYASHAMTDDGGFSPESEDRRNPAERKRRRREKKAADEAAEQDEPQDGLAAIKAQKQAERERKRIEAAEMHDHPGGAGAILGVRLLRFAGVQGTSLLFSNGMQMVQVVVVARLLGPSELGRYALLTFLAGLTAQVFGLLVKPGTIRRTFGGGDDDDGDDDDDEDLDTIVSSSPRHTLGVGIVWSMILALVASGLIVIFRVPLADGLLGDSSEEGLVFWAGLLGGSTVAFKVANIVLWLERRPKAFLISDISRPVLALIGLSIFVGIGGGVQGAIMGTAAGTIAAAVLSIFLLRHSFEWAFDLKEVREIAATGRFRAPIAMSFWLIQNGDIFILSRFVEHNELGLYNLANRLGFVVSFLPQGFRVAMRPLRNSAAFQAVREQYGKSLASGQLLGYFVLLSVFAILAMVVGGELLVDLAPPQYAAAAPLIPLCAGAFVMPALYRTINSNVFLPNKRLFFIGGTVVAAIVFVGLTWLLAPSIGVYAAPIGMLAGFGVSSAYLFIRCQLSDERIEFPYVEIGKATGLAVVVALAFELIPALPTAIHFLLALLILAGYLALLFVFRVIPESHWRPILHMAKSFVRGTTVDQLNPRRGLHTLQPDHREELREAVLVGVEADVLLAGHGAALMGYLRQAGREAGAGAIATPSDREAEVSVFLFEQHAPTAVRNSTMRKLLKEGFSSNDLQALEDFKTHLEKIPAEAWVDTVGKARKPGAAIKRAGRKALNKTGS
jgi:O-antigen/teichoic acid export membrane protein